MVTQTLALLQRQLLDIPGSSSHLSPPAITLILNPNFNLNPYPTQTLTLTQGQKL